VNKLNTPMINSAAIAAFLVSRSIIKSWVRIMWALLPANQ
jgi:hypothetical protein